MVSAYDRGALGGRFSEASFPEREPSQLLFSAESAGAETENYLIPLFIAESCLHPVNKLFLLFK